MHLIPQVAQGYMHGLVNTTCINVRLHAYVWYSVLRTHVCTRWCTWQRIVLCTQLLTVSCMAPCAASCATLLLTTDMHTATHETLDRMVHGHVGSHVWRTVQAQQSSTVFHTFPLHCIVHRSCCCTVPHTGLRSRLRTCQHTVVFGQSSAQGCTQHQLDALCTAM